jgi:hypothetical protein
MKSKYIIWTVVGIIGILLIANYQNIIKSVIPPNPIIVSSKADGSSTKLFDFSILVSGEVRNEGGDRYIVVEATLSQGNHKYTKTQQIHLESYQTSAFKIVFDEAKLMDSDPEYGVRAFALGSLGK